MTCAWIDTSSADTGSSATMNSRLDRQRAGDADALALPARELVRIAARVLGREADQLRAARRSASARAAPGCRPCVASASPSVSPTRRRGFRLAYGSWKMICRLAAAAAASRAPTSARDLDAFEADRRRRSARSAAARERPIVLLPEPDSPTRPEHLARARSSKLTSSTARTGRSRRAEVLLAGRGPRAGGRLRGHQARSSAGSATQRARGCDARPSGGIALRAFGHAPARSAARRRSPAAGRAGSTTWPGIAIQPSLGGRRGAVDARRPRQAGEQAARVGMPRRAEQRAHVALPRPRGRRTSRRRGRRSRRRRRGCG